MKSALVLGDDDGWCGAAAVCTPVQRHNACLDVIESLDVSKKRSRFPLVTVAFAPQICSRFPSRFALERLLISNLRRHVHSPMRSVLAALRAYRIHLKLTYVRAWSLAFCSSVLAQRVLPLVCSSSGEQHTKCIILFGTRDTHRRLYQGNEIQ